MNRIKAFGLASLLALLIGCAQNPQLQQETLDYSFLDDGVVRIGVVSDLEGAVDNAKKTADKFRVQNLDAIIIAGDTYENEQIRRNPIYPDSTDNVREMVSAILPYAQLGIPVFVIPGNHEAKEVYQKGMREIRKNNVNVLDISSGSVDAEGINIVGLGGYHDSRFIASGGFQIADSDYKRAETALTGFAIQNETIILVTHSPPKTGNKIDFVVGAWNVGDAKLNQIIKGSNAAIIHVHGHIHEGGGNTVAVGKSMAINAASVTSYNNPQAPRAAVISISGGNASYEFLP